MRENAVYTTSAVLWLLVCQRLNPDSSLEAAVKRLIESQPSLLPLNKRVTQGTLSSNTGAYSRARSRLSPEVTRWFAQAVSQSLIDATAPAFAQRRVSIVDGTTLALPPEPALLREFSAATNQFGAGAWPIAQVVVAQVPTRQLSFKRTWTTFRVFLLRHRHTDPDPVHWREQYRTALGYATLDKLPHCPQNARQTTRPLK